MIRGGLYEGKITIEHTPETKRAELLTLVHAYGNRAEHLDPQDRVIEIKESRNKIFITTTENQLAAKIAKKIKQSLYAKKVRIAHSKEPYEFEYITISF